MFLYYLELLTWSVPIERAWIIVSIDRARRITIYFTMHRQVTISGNRDTFSGGHGVVEDGLGVGPRGAQFWEHATTCRPVPFFGPDIFRSYRNDTN